MLILVAPRIYIESAVLHDYAVVVEDGLISQIILQEDLKHYPQAEIIRGGDDTFIMPGMIDMHIHGAMGADVMDADVGALNKISWALAKEGVTSWLATTLTAPIEEITAALEVVADYEAPSDGAEIIGVHLEGPFLSPQKAGAHQTQWMVKPDAQLFDRLQTASRDKIKQVTVAPELPGTAAFIRYLVGQDIIASIGHTAADYQTTVDAIEAGAKQATHLYNAMRGICHRHPGAASALLLDDRVMAELIADGVHVDSSLLQLTHRVKGSDGIALVSDAMRAKCMGNGVFELAGQQVTVQDQEARMADGSLAGSVLALNQACHHMIQQVDCDIEDVIQMSCVNPAKQLNLFDRIGSIALGKQADVVLMDEQFNVQDVVVRGHRVISQPQ